MRGGIIGVIIFFVFTISYIACNLRYRDETGILCSLIPSFGAGILFWDTIFRISPYPYFLDSIVYNPKIPYFVFEIGMHITSLIIFFFIGAFIGFIIGKIKSLKRRKK